MFEKNFMKKNTDSLLISITTMEFATIKLISQVSFSRSSNLKNCKIALLVSRSSGFFLFVFLKLGLLSPALIFSGHF